MHFWVSVNLLLKREGHQITFLEQPGQKLGVTSQQVRIPCLFQPYLVWYGVTSQLAPELGRA